MCAGRKNQLTKMNKTYQGNMFIKYPTITKIKEGVLLKDDIQKENLLGNTVEIAVSFERKGIKAT